MFIKTWKLTLVKYNQTIDFIYISPVFPLIFLFLGPIQDIMLHLVVMSPQSSLLCDSFLVFFFVFWDLTVLANYFVDGFSLWACWCFLMLRLRWIFRKNTTEVKCPSYCIMSGVLGGLNHRHLYSHSFGGWRSEIRMPAWLGLGGDPPPDLQMTIFSLYTCMAFPPFMCVGKRDLLL